MTTLLLLSLVGTAAGSIGGIISSGLDGLILGGSIGLIAGVVVWSLASMNAQWRRERRLNSYFTDTSTFTHAPDGRE